LSGEEEPSGEPGKSSGDGAFETDVDALEIASGKVRGYRRRGVDIFKGIPYAGAPTSEYRFAAPPQVVPWSGVRSSLNYGPVCPFHEGQRFELSEMDWPFLLPVGPTTRGAEDCLCINLWTPGIGRAEKLPVMLWLHADGFAGGSSQKYLCCDGENLARTQDVVVASINHRVGALGFLNLAEIAGSDYLDSGNVGMTDIIVALHWIRENIAAFGGDPDNVTLFGQSGGGFKISTLLAMPGAQGLFHKAIIQSGARLRVHDPEDSLRLADAVVSALGLKGSVDARDKLRQLPVAAILSAAVAGAEHIRLENHATPHQAAPAWWFEPTAGVVSLPRHPCDPEAPRSSSRVPILCGVAENEVSPSVEEPDLESTSWPVVAEQLRSTYGTDTERAIASALSVNPEWKPIQVLSVLSSHRFRQQAAEFCLRHVRGRETPVYGYLFSWCTPQLEGRPRAFHMSDVAFVFANTDLVSTQTGGGEEPRRLAAAMSTAWASFARSGDPNHEGLPNWPRYSEESRETLIFDSTVALGASVPGEVSRTGLFDPEHGWKVA
jgi:para-nitrobenzyl esterase